jgi:chemotaxis protein CheC
MTTEHIAAPAELEHDALSEIANITIARAASSMRQMVEHQVLLSVPAVEIISHEAAAQIVGSNRSLVAIRQDFNGAFSGRALLISPETDSLELVRALYGRMLPSQEIVILEDEASAETGNIILNSWVATIANLFRKCRCLCRWSFAETGKASSKLETPRRPSCSSCPSDSKSATRQFMAMLHCLWICRR